MYFCYRCNEPICFSDEYISKNEKYIPLDFKTKRPHNCIISKTRITERSTLKDFSQRVFNFKPTTKIIAHTPINSDRIPTQRLKHFKGTEEEFKEKWK